MRERLEENIQNEVQRQKNGKYERVRDKRDLMRRSNMHIIKFSRRKGDKENGLEMPFENNGCEIFKSNRRYQGINSRHPTNLK